MRGWDRHVLSGVVWMAAGLAAFTPRVSATTVSSCAPVSQTISCTGSFGTSEDVFLESFTQSSAGSLQIQTYGFGGGTNAAGAVIAPGGFDAMIALFSGPPTAATVVLDGASNPIASADNFSLFSPGCPPAGTVTVGSVPGVCGDSRIVVPNLGPGVYTVLLSDASFVALAVNPQVPGAFDLTDTTSNAYGSSTGNGAYTDLTGGVFQTCATSTDCNSDSANFAVDISGNLGQPAPAPEPASMVTTGLTLSLLAGGFVRLRRNVSFQEEKSI